ncbi:uncharacterized protein L3040_003564 [Drepanopeziza brunnea f. sp. 'multigermtubi']|uniref:uncharacterized protein n=1 Tax=Drepanopeziza brunnea f. sp. 'multigermtubi' TaxID=698441 RepID=UPI0023821439|nr:hypothetical protein L3040_003564 [Drepanopeziza brunnea f. sp. 'multigermtubi']
MDSLSNVALHHALKALLWTWVSYIIAQAIYRLYFSPIAKFPGPKLAAVSFWYEYYWDVILGGQYTFQIGRLHQKYGPIIRINPYELHVLSPSFYEKLYAGSGKRRHRWDWFTAQFGLPQSMLASNDHDSHRIRRAALLPFFSKSAARNLQPIMDDRIEVLLHRLQQFRISGEPVTLNYAFSAYTNDIAQEYAFARSDHRLEHPEFEPTFHDALVAGSSQGAIIKQWPWLLPLMQSLPDAINTWMDPNLKSFFSLEHSIRTQIREMKSGQRDDSKNATHRTIFYEILNSDLPESEKSNARLAQDGQVVIVAGTLTTAWALCVAVFHLLSQPEALRKLKAELQTALPTPTSPITLVALEQLPYLTGCIQEAIRLSYGVSTRLQRIAPDETLVFNDGQKDWYIPRGTPVGMSCALVHHDESVFPASRRFLPERWIEHQPHLEKYLVAFSKGSRQCIGINLAYAELYLAVARIFRAYGSSEVRFEGDDGFLELFETDGEDVELCRDTFMPLVKRDSKGVRVRVRGGVAVGK